MKEYLNSIQTYNFALAFKSFEDIVYLGNFLLSDKKFWELKDPAQLDAVLYTTMEILRVSSLLL